MNKDIDRIKELKKELQGYWGIYVQFYGNEQLADISFAQLATIVNVEDSAFTNENQWLIMGYGKHDIYWSEEDGWTKGLGKSVRTGFLKQNLYPTKQEAQRHLISHLMSGTSTFEE